MSTDAPAPKPPSTADLLSTLIDEIRGLRDDMRKRGGLPDVKIGKAKMRDWTGPSYEGKAASECPADFLLEYAGFLEWKAGKNREEGKDAYAAQNEREATMVRRWAAVNRGVVATPERQSFRRPAETPPAPPAAEEGQSAEVPGPQKTTTWNSGSRWSKRTA